MADKKKQTNEWSVSLTNVGGKISVFHVGEVDCVWNVMAHVQKPDLIFRWNGRVHLNRRGRQFSRLLAAEVCTSAVVMLGTPCSEVVWRVLATHSIRQFPLHFPSRASPCAITFQLEFTALQYAVCCKAQKWNTPNKIQINVYWTHKCLTVLFTCWGCQNLLKLQNNDAERVAILAESPFCQHLSPTFQKYVRCCHPASTDLGITKLRSKCY